MRGGGGRPAPRRPPTDEERKAREEKLRAAFPPIQMTFTIDGNPVYERIRRRRRQLQLLARRQHRARASHGRRSPCCACPGRSWRIIPNPFSLINADGRQELFVDYMRVLGPYNPSTAPPAGFRQIFICGEPGSYSPACVRQIVTNLVTRAYRRPATTAAEVQTAADAGGRGPEGRIRSSRRFAWLSNRC